MAVLSKTLAGVAALALLASQAIADVAPPLGSGIHGLVGANLGAALHGQGKSGALVGVEASAAWLDPDRSLWWGGGYLDVLRDVGTGVWRSGVGPEFGWGPFGLDFGLAMRWQDGVRVGWQVRPMLTLGVLSVYGRWESVAGEPGGGFLELGLLIKAAVREPERRRYHRSRPPLPPPQDVSPTEE